MWYSAEAQHLRLVHVVLDEACGVQLRLGGALLLGLSDGFAVHIEACNAHPRTSFSSESHHMKGNICCTGTSQSAYLERMIRNRLLCMS